MPLIPNLHEPGVLEGFFVEDDPNEEAADSVLVYRGKILTRDGRILRKIDLPTSTPVGQIVLQNAEKFRLDLGADYQDTDVFLLLKPQEFGTLQLDEPKKTRFNPTKFAQPVGEPKISITGIGRPNIDDSPIERNDLMSLELVTDLVDRSTEEAIDLKTNTTTTVNASVLLAKITMVGGEVSAVDNSIKELAT